MRRVSLTLAFLLVVSFCFAKEVHKIAQKSADKIVSGRIADVNRIHMAVMNDGNFAHYFHGENEYLHGLKFDELWLIYSSGFWLAANVGTDTLASFSLFTISDFTQGAIDQTDTHFGESDSLLFRVYKINRGDNPVTNPDFRDWPANLGAPTDAYGDPLFLGDQMLWCSFSDAFDAGRFSNTSAPLGAEIHLICWANENIDNVIFLHWEIINKSQNDWKNVFVGIFVDPDMQDAHDDLIASDSTLNMVYCYESAINQFEKTFQAIGYIFLETPAMPAAGDTAITWMGQMPDFANVPAASPMMYKHTPWEWSENIFGPGCSPKQVYDRLDCKDKFGNPMINPLTGELSRWAFCGDPVSQTGWLDDSLRHDRRMMISAGPFDLAAGDTNGVTLAILPVRGENRLFCVSNLKNQVQALQAFFRYSCGIFSSSLNTYEGKKNLKIPIGIINKADLQKIDFTLAYEPQNIVFDSLITSEETSGFSLTTQESDSVVYCSIEAPSAPFPAGKYEIAYAIFHVKNKIESDTSKIFISDVFCTDQFSTKRRIPGTQAIVSLYIVPSVSRLMFPANEQFVDGLTVNFRWTKPQEVKNNVYQLVFLDEKLRQFNQKMTGTDFSMAVEDFIVNGCYDVSWTVNIITPDSIIASPDTFRFHLPDSTQLQILKELYTIELPADTSFWEEVRAITENEGILYVFTQVETRANPPDFYARVWLYQLNNDQAQWLNTQKLDFGRYYDEIVRVQFVENELYIFLEYKALIYEIEPDFQLTRKGMFYFSSAGGAILFDNNIFSVHQTYGNPPELKEFTIQNNYSVRETAHYELTDWNAPVEMKSRFDFHFPFLYLALGSWGVFYVHDPDTIRLLARREVSGKATAIARSLPYLYVGTSDNRLYVYDATWYGNPQLLHWEQVVSPHYQFDSIDEMLVFDGYLCFAHRWGDTFSVCHFEPGHGFKLDGIMSGQEVILRDDRIILRKRNKIKVCRNYLLSSVAKNDKLPKMTFEIFQNYPNPFNPRTTIKFSLKKPWLAQLKVYNVLGQEVAVLVNKQLSSGIHSAQWDGRDKAGNYVRSGVYFAKLSADGETRIIKMALLR